VLDSGVLAAKFASPELLELLLLQALQDTHTPASPLAGRRTGIPAAPDLVGRGTEVAGLVRAWLSVPPRPVAVLGAPGIGKSSICLAALHTARVAERFGARRWFVRCDGATSADAVVSAVAAELGVIGGGAGDLADRVRSVLGPVPGVVVLDNFETPWTADPVPVEELLRWLAAIPGLGLAITVRGASRPAGPRWREFAMVSPLSLDQARRLFVNVAGPNPAIDDRSLDELLAELDGVPLAVELLAYAAQGQPLDQVGAQWRHERTGMLVRMGGKRRELSVSVSVETSVGSPLMTGPGRRLLGLLGVLPDGIAHPDIDVLLPTMGLTAAAVLRQLGLAFDEADRLRTLAPVRDHIAATHPPIQTDLDRAAAHYAQIAAAAGNQVGRSQGAQAVAWLQAETGNITAMLSQATTGQNTQQLSDALLGLADYWRITEVAQPQLADTILHAISTHGTPAQQANVLLALGMLALDRDIYDLARARFEQALRLFQRTGDVLGQANCILCLGGIALRRSDHTTAGDHYRQALPLYQQVGSLLGEANCIKRLGDMALARSDLTTAHDRYQQALPLFQQVGDVLGEANCISGLGDIAQNRSEYNTACDHYQQALSLHQQIGSVRGEASCSSNLGDIALARSDYGTAHDYYEQALSLYQAIPEPHLIGWTHIRLAQLSEPGKQRLEHWQAARAAWASIERHDLIASAAKAFEE